MIRFWYSRLKCATSCGPNSYYGRGSASVYDHWVSLGNPGWGWDEVYPLFIKVCLCPYERNLEFCWHKSYLAYSLQPTKPKYRLRSQLSDLGCLRLLDGPLQIGFQGYIPDSNVGFIKACKAVNIAIVEELNNGNNTGVKQGTGCLDSRCRRSSSYNSFYKKTANRSNLDVLHYARVQSLQFVKNSTGAPTASGFVFIDEPTGLIHTVKAKKEVIIKMGALHSPQSLMVSVSRQSSGCQGWSLIGSRVSVLLENFQNSASHQSWSTRTLDRSKSIETLWNAYSKPPRMNDHNVFSIMAIYTPEASTSTINNDLAKLEAAQAEFYANDSGTYTAPSSMTNKHL